MRDLLSSENDGHTRHPNTFTHRLDVAHGESKSKGEEKEGPPAFANIKDDAVPLEALSELEPDVDLEEGWALEELREAEGGDSSLDEAEGAGIEDPATPQGFIKEEGVYLSRRDLEAIKAQCSRYAQRSKSSRIHVLKAYVTAKRISQESGQQEVDKFVRDIGNPLLAKMAHMYPWMYK
jgi:hypothetical protein